MTSLRLLTMGLSHRRRSLATLTAGSRLRLGLIPAGPKKKRFEAERGRCCGYLACHWRSRLSFLLTPTLATSESGPRANPYWSGELLLVAETNKEHAQQNQR